MAKPISGNDVQEALPLFQEASGGAIPTLPHQFKDSVPYYIKLSSITEQFQRDILSLQSAKQLSIRRIPHGAANDFALNHHYLRRKVYIAKNVSYGVYYKQWLVGVCMFGYPVWTTYPDLVPPYKPAEVPELTRLATLSCVPPNSATRIMSVCIKMMKSDWEQETGHKPKVIFTMADISYGFSGTIYKAANFKFLKRTKGRPTNPGGTHGRWRKNKFEQKALKHVYVFEYDRSHNSS